MLTIFFCVCMYSIARVDKQKGPQWWFLITLGWIVLFALITGSRFSPIFGFLCAFASLWWKKYKMDNKPPLY